ncbi:MAG: hypothetical protein ABIG55_05115, partial [Candidatus Omnitrophota bacterium]
MWKKIDGDNGIGHRAQGTALRKTKEEGRGTKDEIASLPACRQAGARNDGVGAAMTSGDRRTSCYLVIPTDFCEALAKQKSGGIRLNTRKISRL